MKKSYISLLLVVCLLLSISAPTAHAAGVNYFEQIESRFGFTLLDPEGLFQTPLAPKLFSTVDRSFQALGDSFIMQVTNNYKARGCTTSMAFKTRDMEGIGGLFSWLDGAYVTIDCRVLPNVTTGELNPPSDRILIHEFGHMVYYDMHKALEQNTIENQWATANQNMPYPISESLAITPYGSGSQEEDFAETFSYMFSQQDRLALARQIYFKESTILTAKVKLIDKLMSERYPQYVGLTGTGFVWPTKPSHWAQATIDDLVNLDLLHGQFEVYNTNPITRAAFCQYIVEFLLGVEIEYDSTNYREVFPSNYNELLYQNTFSDVKPEKWTEPFQLDAAYCINLAYNMGIVSGKGDGTFDPKGFITREEAAKMLATACAARGTDISPTLPTTFVDTSSISSWAMPYVSFMSQAGIMNGEGGGLFSPKGTYSHEQTYITVYRILTGSEAE